MAALTLSILEFGFIKPPKLQAYQTINHLLEEVEIYEQLGYKRLWLSEHYSSEFAWYSPEMLLPLLAGYSEHIKIGWAGVLLNMHKPLLVASNARILSALFNDRIDLGFAAAGAAPHIKKLLGVSQDPWEKQVEELVNLSRGLWEEPISGKKVIVPPHGTSAPNLWYLTIGDRNLSIGVKNKLNLALSLMHPGSNYSKNLETIKKYNALYYEAHGTIPETSILIASACGVNGRVKHLLEKKYTIDGFSNLFGSQHYVMDELMKIQEVFQNSEFCIYNPYCNRLKRLESYTKLSEVKLSYV